MLNFQIDCLNRPMVGLNSKVYCLDIQVEILYMYTDV